MNITKIKNNNYLKAKMRFVGGRLSIPKIIREELNIKDGDMFVISKENNKIILTPSLQENDEE